MTSNRSILFLFLAVVLALASLWSAGGPLVAQGALAEPPPGDGPWVVRAYYTDPQMVASVASWSEPWEVHTPDTSRAGEGYLVVDVDRDGYMRLVDLGFRLAIDQALTKQLTEPRAYLDGQTDAIPGFPCYRTVEETFDTALQIVAGHPDLASWIDVGDSWEKVTPGGNAGYDMMVLRLTNANVPGPKPKLFVMSAVHAREYATAELVTRFAEYLIDNYGVDADVTWLLDYHEIHLMLQSNPDGRKQAETGLSWRKNTNENYCSPTSNYRGADLNRNYPFQWGCCGGSSGYECDATYRGPFENSEPETQSVVAYVASEFPDQRNDDLVSPAPDDATGIFLDIHSYSELVMWSWGFTSSPAPNSTQLQTLGRKFAYYNDYTPQQSMQLYPTDGTTDDWAYGRLGLASYCFEIGTSFFQDCSSFESTILPENMGALLYAAKAARTPYMTPAGPDTVDVTATPGGVLPGESVALTAIVDDTRYNNSGGTEPTQNIVAAEYYIDIPPWVTTTTPIAYPMAAVDGSFNETVEDIEATIDTTALNAGRHILYVRGQDALGHWGPVSAEFLYVLDPAISPVIEGTVLDAVTGMPLAATVTAGPFQAGTDPGTGLYSLTVVSGTYDVTATAADHAPVTVEDVVALDGETVQVDFDLMPVCTVWEDDVESGTAGWTPTGQWATTTIASHSPTHSWTDSPGGSYGNNWNYTLTAPPIDLSGATDTTLSFWHQYDLEDGYDFAYLEYSTDGGSTWTVAATYNGEQTLPAWEPETISLPELDGFPDARIRFRIDTDTSVVEDGWYLDDFEVRAAAPACATCAPVTGLDFSLITAGEIWPGQPVEFEAELAPDEVSAPYRYSLALDDGTQLVSGTSLVEPFVLTTTFDTAGAYRVVASVWNCDMDPAEAVTGSLAVTVTEPCTGVTSVDLSPLTPMPAYLANPVEFGVALAPPSASAPYSYTIDYGDATVESGAAGDATFTLGHLYAEPGTYTVGIDVWNCDIDPTEAVTDVVVIYTTDVCASVVTATLSLLSPPPLAAGSPVDFTVDLEPANATPPFSYTVSFGDGSEAQGTASERPFALQHAYVQPGAYTVTVEVSNCDATFPVTATLGLEVVAIHRIYLPLIVK